MNRLQQNISKLILQTMPQRLRDQVIRRKALVPEFTLDSRLTVKLADTKEELEEAYRILHDCYVDQKLMAPSPDRLRCNIFTFLPETSTVIARFEGKIVATVSLILDSAFGLPSDSEYLDENNRLRGLGSRLVEVSALAVDKSFRHQGHAVSFMLMKFLYQYSRHWMMGTHLVCVVHPRAEDFYRALFHFRREGRIVGYQSVQGAAGIYMNMEMSQEHQENLLKAFDKIEKSLPEFMIAPDDRVNLPQRSEGQIVDPIMTPRLLEYFLMIRTRVIDGLTPQKRYQLLSIYRGCYGDLGRLDHYLESTIGLSDLRHIEYRIPTHLHATVLVNGEMIRSGIICDLTSKGCYLKTTAWQVHQSGQNVVVQFRFAGKMYQQKSTVRWINPPGNHRHDSGIGVSFNEPLAAARSLFQNWRYRSAG